MEHPTVSVAGVGTQAHVTRDGQPRELSADVGHCLHHGVGLRLARPAVSLLGHLLRDPEQQDRGEAISNHRGQEVQHGPAAPPGHPGQTGYLLPENEEL